LVNNPGLRSKLHISSLCGFFNQLLMLENNVCGLRSRDTEGIILPEEKRLLGFLPFCRTFENLNCLIEESDPRISWVRIHRTLKCADSLSESRLGFIERHGPSGYFVEIAVAVQAGQSPTPSVTKPPIRRNVAFQSIFNQLGSESCNQVGNPLIAANASETEPGLPVSSQTANFNTPVEAGTGSQDILPFHSPPPGLGYSENVLDVYMNANRASGVEWTPSVGIIGCRLSVSSPISRPGPDALTPTNYLTSSRSDGAESGDNDNTDFSALFRSIWTPRHDDTGKSGADGWSA